jgi:murein DD-endopeptidase MepM/ murein hydrolase activator NlpD
VAGIVTIAGQDKWGTIAVRDANGFSHEILHTQSQHVTVGDPVVAGQLIGTMGNTGTKDQHVHYQLRDPAGKNINPTEFWDRQGLANPNPDPPAYLGEYQSFGDRFGDWTSSPAGDAPLNSPQPASQSVLPDQLNSPGDLAGWIAALAGIDPQNPNRFAPTPQNDQLRGFNRNDPLQPWFARPPIR